MSGGPSAFRVGRHGRLVAQGRWQYPTTDYPNRTVGLRCGPASVACRLIDPAFDPITWHDPPGPTDRFAVAQPIDAAAVALQQEQRPSVRIEGSSIRISGPAGCVFDAPETEPELHYVAHADFAARVAGVRWLLNNWLLARATLEGAVVLHAASFAGDRGVWVVAGASHAGKSTLVARMADRGWNEEHAVVAPTATGPRVWAFPHARSSFRPGPATAPLAGMAFLTPERSQTRATPVAPGDAYAQLAAQLGVFAGDIATEQLDRLGRLVERGPVLALDHDLRQPASAVLAELERASAGASRHD